MFRWLKTRFQQLVKQAVQKEIERLLLERERLRAELLKANGGKPIRLTASERAKLDALRDKLDPEFVEKYNLRADYE